MKLKRYYGGTGTIQAKQDPDRQRKCKQDTWRKSHGPPGRAQAKKETFSPSAQTHRKMIRSPQPASTAAKPEAPTCKKSNLAQEGRRRASFLGPF